MTVQEPIEYLEQHGFIADEVKDMCIEVLVQVEQYRALGTVEELKEAREKQIPIKIEEIHVDEYYCPACGSELNCNDAKVEDKYCSECGQRLCVEEGETSE